jgi:hypothetical protein
MTTGSFPSSISRVTFFATLLIRSMLATEVPPNFCTITLKIFLYIIWNFKQYKNKNSLAAKQELKIKFEKSQIL